MKQGMPQKIPQGDMFIKHSSSCVAPGSMKSDELPSPLGERVRVRGQTGAGEKT